MNKAVIAFRSVEIDMDGFVDCTERGAQSATKLYNQEDVQGTRVCGINYCLYNSILNIWNLPINRCLPHLLQQCITAAKRLAAEEPVICR